MLTNEGFNGSKSHTDPWPVLNVGRCDRVTVHLENQDNQAHGFAITHYLDSGVKIQPGQTYDYSFNANRSGSFVVYCNILCSIHLYMQNGRLNVR
jgi:heme/copper-type cytochrome/quinol oxidase subunit 2